MHNSKIDRREADRADILRLSANVRELMADLEQAKKWKEAVIDKLMVTHIYSGKHEYTPVEALNDLINWNVSVALDPAVSSSARLLQLNEENKWRFRFDRMKAVLLHYADDPATGQYARNALEEFDRGHGPHAVLADRNMTLCVIGSLIHKFGEGVVTIAQSELDAVESCIVTEQMVSTDNGETALALSLVRPNAKG